MFAIISIVGAELEKPKIGISGKELTPADTSDNIFFKTLMININKLSLM